MHPFSLNDEHIEQVNGGLFGSIIAPPDDRYYGPRLPGEETTMAIGEEGGFPGWLD